MWPSIQFGYDVLKRDKISGNKVLITNLFSTAVKSIVITDVRSCHQIHTENCYNCKTLTKTCSILGKTTVFPSMLYGRSRHFYG